MNQGWISINRSILNHWIWQDEKYFRWWITILLTVNHESKKFPVSNEIFICNPGESFRSIDDWSSQFGCSKPTTLNFFKLLESDGMVRTKTVGKGNRRKHLLTVVNWQKYQQKETENFTENKPKRLPKINPNVPPNNNDNNDNNENNDSDLVQKIVDFYNQTCISLPKIQKITEHRKKLIKSILKEYKKKDLATVIENAQKSNFLTGGNDRAWVADFDWLMKPKNFLKVLEGNFTNREQKEPTEIYIPNKN